MKPTYIIIDQQSHYYIYEKRDILIFEIYHSSNNEISYEDLKKFYQNNSNLPLRYDKKTGFLIDEERKLLFIPLFNKDSILLDYTYSELENYDLLSQYNFYLHRINGKKYVKSTNSKSMHEIIFGRKARKGYKLDHNDSNGLDNRRAKISEITAGANSANQIKRQGTSSKYIGVTVRHQKNYTNWEAAISFERKIRYLGSFRTEIDAARMRDVYSIHYYRGDVALNRDENDDLLLTKEEIEDILQNGIPEKYQIKEKTERDLPPNIEIVDRIKKYRYCIQFRKVRHSKGFKTQEEAEEALEILKESFSEIERLEKLELENNVVRNSDGIPILYTHDKEGNINGEYLVDEEIWKIWIHCSLSNNDGYANGVINDVSISLHIYVYKYYYGDIPEGMTIDHKDPYKKDDCRIENLRAATASQQGQNRKKIENTIFKYRGIVLQTGQFFCEIRVKGKVIQKGPFKILEDSAKTYNELALEYYGEDASLNIVDNKRTSIEDLFHKNNLTLEYIQEIKTITEIKTIFIVNQDWKKSVKNVLKHKESDVLKKNIDKYKEVILDLKKQELAIQNKLEEIPEIKKNWKLVIIN